MKYLVLLLLLGALCGCEREATPQEATATARRTIDQADAIQKDSQKRVQENDALTSGK
ncbi:hypothetical protein [Armatimonas rosea]|uniref:Uncharacterized protein n=1 Tax=Armatimonas rosea TaxID=685828 RepID=A0A7W9SVJ9_ARMRO|nr:hypothetical protein [Armatimonas rosea]MBB6053481.1 hypothetical protein [Armatimonas rosea]